MSIPCIMLIKFILYYPLNFYNYYYFLTIIFVAHIISIIIFHYSYDYNSDHHVKHSSNWPLAC